MKRKLLSKGALFLVMLMVMMCLAACGGSKDKEAATEGTEATVKSTLTEEDGTIGGPLEDGTYDMTSLSIDGEDFPKLMEGLKKTGVNMTLVVNGTQIKLMEEDYTLKDGKFVNDEQICEYAVNGSIVTVLDDDNSKMRFEKK